jgi:hypothetical protein
VRVNKYCVFLVDLYWRYDVEFWRIRMHFSYSMVKKETKLTLKEWTCTTFVYIYTKCAFVGRSFDVKWEILGHFLFGRNPEIILDISNKSQNTISASIFSLHLFFTFSLFIFSFFFAKTGSFYRELNIKFVKSI